MVCVDVLVVGGLGCVPVRIACCSGTDGAMFRYMPRAGYRQGEKRVDVWLSVAGHARLVELARGWDCSLSDAVVRLVREKVAGDGSGDDRSGVGRHPVSGGGVARVVSGGDGEDSVGVGSDRGGDSFVMPGWAEEILVGEPRPAVLRVVRDGDVASSMGVDEFLHLP